MAQREDYSVMDWSSERRYIIYLEVHSQIDSQRLEISRERSQVNNIIYYYLIEPLVIV